MEGNVFTGVRHSVPGESSCDHYPWCIGTWVPPSPLDNRRGDLPPPPPPPPALQTWGPTLPVPCYLHQVVITGDMFKLVQWRTCPPPPPHSTGTDIHWWPLKHVWLERGWYASYWNAVLCCQQSCQWILSFFLGTIDNKLGKKIKINLLCCK